jgi:hypothetical protein
MRDGRTSGLRSLGSRKIPRIGALACAVLFSGVGSAESDPSGTYVFISQSRSVTKLPVVKDYVALTRSVAVVELRSDGKRLIGSGPLCSVELAGSSSMVRMELPAAFQRSLPPVRIDATLKKQGSSVRFEQAPQTVVVGARLRDPIREKLPESADDARVVDQDRDGRPGVTVRVHGIVSGEVFVVQRSTSQLRGVQDEKGFSGQVIFQNEQSVLGATSPFLKGNRASEPTREGSWFRLERLQKGQKCDAAQARARTIFSAE